MNRGGGCGCLLLLAFLACLALVMVGQVLSALLLGRG